jgi:hypothetical protein
MKSTLRSTRIFFCSRPFTHQQHVPPASLLRITSSHSILFGDVARGATGLLHFLDFYHTQSQKKQAKILGVIAKKGSLSCLQIAMSL